nr:hypothetical protein 12 [bacterium]
MKKLFLFISALFLVVGFSFGQTKIGAYSTFAGAAGDTLTASATKSYTLEFTGYKNDLGADIQVWTDLVSGTATFGYKYWWSNDGTNFPATAADSVTSAKSHASDWNDVISITTVAGRYLKISLIATSATQKSKIYGYVRTYKK